VLILDSKTIGTLGDGEDKADRVDLYEVANKSPCPAEPSPNGIVDLSTPTQTHLNKETEVPFCSVNALCP
jgi:hypothetical protein